MTGKDVEKLFELFNAIRTEKIKLDDKAKLAWTLIFEPYEYETVKAAALQFMRKHSYAPRPDEIIAEIPQEPAAAPEEEKADDDPPTPQEAKAMKLYKIICATRKAKGLPEHLSEAHAHGMTARELADKYDEANVSFEPVARAYCGK